MGFASTLNDKSNTAAWVIAEVIASIGLGTLLTTLLPAVLAPLNEKDKVAATAAFSFLRSLGLVFGVTLPGFVFNNAFAVYEGVISDAYVRLELSGGMAYGSTASPGLKSFSGTLHEQVIEAYTMSIRSVWCVALGFSLLGLVATFAERKIELRTSLERDFGMSRSVE